MTKIKIALSLAASLIGTSSFAIVKEDSSAIQPGTHVTITVQLEPVTSTSFTVDPMIEPVVQQKLTPAQLNQAWEQHFAQNYISIREKALTEIQWSNGFFMALALGNFKSVMNQNPLPHIKHWPVRGTCKKYNKQIVQKITAHIDQQKNAYIAALSQ